MSDPRSPALPLATEEDENHVILRSDGAVRRHLNMIYSEDDVERIRLGYCCLNCGESVVGHGKGEPFPEECAVCRFRMRDKQLARFESEWVGNIRLGPGTSMEEELAALQEIEDRQNRFVEKPSIWVPRSI